MSRFNGSNSEDFQGEFSLVASGVDSISPHISKMLELAIEYIKQDDEDMSAFAYAQSVREEDPWVVIAANDPLSLVKVVAELLQSHCEPSIDFDDLLEDL